MLVATKFHYPTGPGPNDRGNSRAHLIRACEESLQRLRLDHIDLYQSHRPDMDVPLDETLGALDDLVRAGKVRYVGTSTSPAWHVMEAIMTAELKGVVRVVSEQSPYNLLDRRIENELLPMCRRHGVGVLCWSPLAMGMLAGRYASETGREADSRAALRGGIYAERVTAAGIETGNAFAALARAAGYEPALLAALWTKDQPGVTAPIIGPKSVEQLTGLLPAGDMDLPDDIRAACDQLVTPGQLRRELLQLGDVDGLEALSEEEPDMPVLNDAARKVITGGNLAHIVTLDEDGTPNVVCIWTGMDGDEIVSAHLGDQRKLRNVRRDPRVVVSYQSPTRNAQDVDEHLVVYGTGRVQEGGGAKLLQELAHVYFGDDRRFPDTDTPPDGYVLRITPERVTGWGPWKD